MKYNYDTLQKRCEKLSKANHKKCRDLIKKDYAIERLNEEKQLLTKELEEKDLLIGYLYEVLYKIDH